MINDIAVKSAQNVMYIAENKTDSVYLVRDIIMIGVVPPKIVIPKLYPIDTPLYRTFVGNKFDKINSNEAAIGANKIAVRQTLNTENKKVPLAAK